MGPAYYGSLYYQYVDLERLVPGPACFAMSAIIYE